MRVGFLRVSNHGVGQWERPQRPYPKAERSDEQIGHAINI